MEYFTEDLWNRINSSDFDEKKKARDQWKLNDEAYTIKFQSLEARFSKKAFDFFKRSSLHDSSLNDIVIEHKEFGRAKKITVSIILTDQERVWTITYKKVSKISVDYVKKKGLYNNQKGFDDFGYDEFLDVDEDTLSHEILFASGAKSLVHFANKNIFVTVKKQED
ncbi:hypothetical protein [Desulfosporosinus sp. OT]|uniref:hypothetical protein n=1 Tax=Desulfosporosinus sp. OT TaxID=913865 RepID=UPI0002239CE1|nr:hypothetical protein [Desulfosporosinus sp. OT]EGW39340.1 hypothetical protein DOT_2625 [Desulfosporosinus sp. OT]